MRAKINSQTIPTGNQNRTTARINHGPLMPNTYAKAILKQRATRAESRNCLLAGCSFAPHAGQSSGLPGSTSLFLNVPPQKGHFNKGHLIFFSSFQVSVQTRGGKR
jgi:hypothetical protein